MPVPTVTRYDGQPMPRPIQSRWQPYPAPGSGGSGVTFANGQTQALPSGRQGPRSEPQGPPGGWPAWQQQQNQASGQPVEVSAGVWVYPNGQPVTGAQLQALNSASTVLPASANAENATVLAAQQAADLAASTSAATPTTSYFSESTLIPPYTNGAVLGIGAGGAILLYLFMRRR